MDDYSGYNQIKMVIVAIKKLDEPCGCRKESKDCQLLLAKLAVEVNWQQVISFIIFCVTKTRETLLSSVMPS